MVAQLLSNYYWESIHTVPYKQTNTSEHRGHFHKPPQGKTEVNGKLWHRFTTKVDNITNFKDYGKLHIQFCLRLSQLFLNIKKILGKLKEIPLFLVFTQVTDFINTHFVVT